MKFAKGPHLKGEHREICPGWVSAGALESIAIVLVP